MGITPDPRSDTALAYARFSQTLMGFEIIGAQAQDAGPNVRIKKRA